MPKSETNGIKYALLKTSCTQLADDNLIYIKIIFINGYTQSSRYTIQ